jgi:hypothetical protein
MFINVTDKQVRSKSFRVFSRKVFVQMRDTANRYDAIENAILLVKNINKLSRSFNIREERTRNIYSEIQRYSKESSEKCNREKHTKSRTFAQEIIAR